MTNININQDKELFARIAANDALAFRQLFDKYFKPLYFNSFKLLKSEFWAEELAQEGLLHVWEARNTLTSIENPGAWLFRVVAHKCLDRIRRQEVELRAQYFISKSENTAPTEDYDYNLLQKLVKEAVDQLPEQQQAVYKLRQEKEFSYKEIATTLNISPNTVRNHLVRAFSSIRTYLLNNGEFLPILVLIFF